MEERVAVGAAEKAEEKEVNKKKGQKMKKYAIVIVIALWLCVLVLGQRGRYDFSVPIDISSMIGDWIPDTDDTYSIGSENFRVKEIWVGPDSLHIGDYALQRDAVDADGLEINGSIHSAAVNGVSGNICIHDGNEPTASNSLDGSRLWVDPSGVLKHQKSSNAGGGSVVIATGSGDLSDYLKKDGSVSLTSDWDIGAGRKILADEIRARDTAGLKLYDDGEKGIFVKDGGNVGIGTETPKRQFDFDGGNVRTQRYLDSDLNTNLGYETFGAGNLSGTYNSAFGRQALYSITSGANNCAFGSNSLYGVTSGGNNIAMGYNAEMAITEGNHNISLGYKSGYVITTGNNNISIGAYGNYAGTGSKNILIGYNIDLPADAGDNQLNIGNLIYGTGLDGVDKTISTGKVGIGTATPGAKLHVYSGSSPITSERSSSTINTSLRCLELERKTTGTAVNGIGGEMAFKIEDDGGGTETAGTIGVTLTDVSAESEEGAMIFEVVSDSSLVEGMRIQGLSGGSANIEIPGNITVTENFYIYDATGGRISVQTDGTYLFNPAGGLWFGMKDDGNSSKGNIYPATDNTYDLGTSSLRWDDVWATNGTIQTSDERRKNDIADLNYGIDEINQLRPISFKWKKSKDNRTKLGLIAQEIIDILPEVVYGSEEEFYGINYGDLVPIVIRAIQEQQKQIDELTKRIRMIEFQYK